ncbi:MAG TPA: PAS domain S-box protein [Pyrinomonadaceae bacterium]|nr:PAS domain S-box protein [Pyrinomonadaceae bacterium]
MSDERVITGQPSNESIAFEDLRQRERELSDFIENAAVGLHWVGADGTILWANECELHLLGYTREEYIGHNITEFHADGEVINDILRRLKNKETLNDYEARLRSKDGSIRHVLINSNVMWDADKFVHTRCFTRDITERKQVEEELQKSRRQLETVCNNATVSLFILDEHQHCVFMNPAAEKLTGYTFGELQGRPLHDFVHHTRPDGSPYPREECPLDRALPRNNQEKGEEIFVHKDGTFYAAAFTASPVREGGVPTGTIIEVRDTSEEKRATEERERLLLLEQEAREETETINQLGQVLSAELDLHKLVQAVTDAATDLTGAHFGSFFYNLIDARGESYMLYTLSGVPREAFAHFPMPRNTDIFAPTFSGGGVVRIADVKEDPRYGKNSPYYGMPEGHLPVVSYLAVPVISRSGEVLGGLFFGHPKAGVFTERHERLVVGLAAQTAVAMDNAQLYEAAKHERSKAQGAQVQISNILESITDAFFALDREWRFTYINQQAEPLLQHTREEMLGKNIWDEFPTAVGSNFDRQYRKAVSEQVSVSFEEYFPLMDSWFEVHAYPSQDGLSVYFHDITERRRATEALFERTRLAELNADVGLALTGSDSLDDMLRRCTEAIVQHLDAAFARIWTLNSKEGVLELQASAGMYTHLDGPHGRVPIGEFKIGRIAQERQPHLTNEVIGDPLVSDQEWAKREEMVAFAGYPLIVEERLVGVVAMFARRPLLEARLQAMSSVANAIALGIEHKWVEEERTRLLASEQEARREAESANRLKDEFLATVSHELRTPLTAIMGWAHLLRAGQIDAKGAGNALETIERNARAQSQLIDDLLDVSRIITGKLRLDVRQIDPSSFIESAIEALHPAAEAKDIRIQKVMDTGVISVAGDPARLQQVVWNLLSNAIKFTPKGGRVQVRLERVNSHIEIVVSDTGVGIRPEFLPHVFDRFRQADQATTRQHGGLGLGLAIVRHLVELHGGTIQAESRGEDQGATFTVKLPVVPVYQKENFDERVHPAARDALPSFGYPEKLDGLKILVVDDEGDTRELLSIGLKQCGAEVTLAGSVKEALKTIEKARPEILISDIGMPVEDGYELIKKVRALPAERGGKIPAIALTAYARTEDRLRALRTGYQMHVPKPVELAELVAVIASLVQRSK